MRQWQNLAAQVKETKVSKVSGTASLEEEQLADANAIVEDLRRLSKQITAQQSEIARARREKLMAKDEADKELDHLDELHVKVEVALANALKTAPLAARNASIFSPREAGNSSQLCADATRFKSRLRPPSRSISPNSPSECATRAR